MVDADDRLAERVAQRLGGLDADEQRAHQARAGGDGDAVEVGELDAGLGGRATQDRHDGGDVLARRHLGHDAAVLRVHLDLRRHDVGTDPASVLDDRRGSFVAGGFDSENEHE